MIANEQSNVDFVPYDELTKLYHNDFDEQASDKKHIVIMTRNTPLNELMAMPVLRNPYITKEIFTSAYHERTLREAMDDQSRDFFKHHRVTISSLSDGGLTNFMQKAEFDAKSHGKPIRSTYVEGGPSFLHHILDPEVTPSPTDLPIDYLLLTRRWSKEHPLPSSYLIGKAFNKTDFDRVFMKREDSRVFAGSDATYRVATYVNKSLAN